MYILTFQEYKQKCKIQCFLEQNKISKERSKRTKKFMNQSAFCK